MEVGIDFLDGFSLIQVLCPDDKINEILLCVPVCDKFLYENCGLNTG